MVIYSYKSQNGVRRIPLFAVVSSTTCGWLYRDIRWRWFEVNGRRFWGCLRFQPRATIGCSSDPTDHHAERCERIAGFSIDTSDFARISHTHGETCYVWIVSIEAVFRFFSLPKFFLLFFHPAGKPKNGGYQDYQDILKKKWLKMTIKRQHTWINLP